MNGRNLRLGLFILLAVVQLAVAAGAIIRSEIALRTGEVYRFRLQPVDPVDAFRGRYVNLRFAVERAPVREGLPHFPQQRVYVPLVIDDEGFAVFGPVDLEPPAMGGFLRLLSGVDHEDDDGNRVLSLALPFRRYYMNEELAKEVDRSLWRRGGRSAWVAVRVWKGTGVIEDLYVDGLPVRDWLAAGGPKAPPTEQ